jgi:regulator of RNase E activity RraB
MLTFICQKLINLYDTDFVSAIKSASEVFNGHSMMAYDLSELEAKMNKELIPLQDKFNELYEIVAEAYEDPEKEKNSKSYTANPDNERGEDKFALVFGYK